MGTTGFPALIASAVFVTPISTNAFPVLISTIFISRPSRGGFPEVSKGSYISMYSTAGSFCLKW